MTSLTARLARAKARLFGTAARDVPVPFEIACDCGHRIAGIRRPDYQLALCSACDARIYVLPVNVYPATRRVQSEVVDGPVARRVGTVVRDLVVGDRHEVPDDDANDSRRIADRQTSGRPVEVPGDDDTADNNRSTVKRRKQPDAAAESATDGHAKRAVREPELELPLLLSPRRTLGERLKKLFSPARLLAVAGGGILVATIWWNIHQRQLTQARKTWRLEMDLAVDAMKKDDVVLVRESLSKAVEAATTLHRHDSEANEATALLWQAEAVDQLGSNDFVSQFSGMIGKDGKFDPTKAADAGRSLVGQRLLFETPLKPAISAEGSPVLDLPLVIDGIPVIITAPSKLLLTCSAAEPTKALLFIGIIANCQAPNPEAMQWRISLEGDSCTLITHAFFAKQLGYDVKNDQGLKVLLERQAEFVKSAGVLANELVDSPKRSKLK